MKIAILNLELSRLAGLRNAALLATLRKQLPALVAALGLAVSTTGVGAANILLNAGLDQTGITSQVNPAPISWTIDASKTLSGPFFDGADSETWCDVGNTGGYGLFFKPFQGDQPSGDLLTVYFYQDNPATPGTKFTLSGYAACEANYSGLFTTNKPSPKTLFVVEFLDTKGTVIASNALDLIAANLPSAGPSSMAQLTMPTVTAPSNTVTVRAGALMMNTYNTTGAQSFFVDDFDLESEAPAGSPVITSQPSQVTLAPGAKATFSVTVSNTAGLTYQWQHATTNLVNGGNISGADQSTLTVTNVSATDAGHYRVLISNSSGSVYSADATLTLQTLNFFPVIALTGTLGDTYEIDYATALAPTTWIPWSTNKLTASPQLIVDTNSPGVNQRFYRSLFLH